MFRETKQLRSISPLHSSLIIREIKYIFLVRTSTTNYTVSGYGLSQFQVTVV